MTGQNQEKHGEEIERRFLLKRIPEGMMHSPLLRITQKYFIDEDGLERRIRKTIDDDNQVSYDWNRKFVKEHGVNDEKEGPLTKSEYLVREKKCTHGLEKKRYLMKKGELVWEVDNFKNMAPIIAEIETPTKDYPLEIPSFIQDVLIMEITGMREFSNRALAEHLKNEKK